MTPTGGSRQTRATTVRIPRPVYEQAKHLVDSERTSSATYFSLNDFFVDAIEAYVQLSRRRQIDAAFASMGEDADYQREATLLSADFEQSDRGSLSMIQEEEPNRDNSTPR
jgi:hypothetical protein